MEGWMHTNCLSVCSRETLDSSLKVLPICKYAFVVIVEGWWGRSCFEGGVLREATVWQEGEGKGRAGGGGCLPRAFLPQEGTASLGTGLCR